MAKRIIVVGAGILGATISWHLAKGGADVTVLEAGDAGGLATRNSWAWINASWGNPRPYFQLRARSMAEWRRLEREVPGLAVNWCGGLIWDLEPQALSAFAGEHAAWGYDIREVGPQEIRRLEPGLKQVPELACHAPGEGAIEPLGAARAILAGAVAQGARLLEHTHVKWLVESQGVVSGVMTNEGAIHAEETVVAAGGGAVQLLESIGVGLRLGSPPGLLAHSRPLGDLLRGLVLAPGIHVRQTPEGRLVAGTDFAGADPMGRANEMAREMMEQLRLLLAGAETVELDFHTIGYRPTPADGFPAVGRSGDRAGLYLAVCHSGVTLAPAIGLFAARELLDGMREPLLDSYQPGRPGLA